MARLAVSLLTVLGTLAFGAPWPAIGGEMPPPPASTETDCDPSQLESIACGTYYFNVAGRVVYSGSGGAHVPIRSARFFEADRRVQKTRRSRTLPAAGYVSRSSS